MQLPRIHWPTIYGDIVRSVLAYAIVILLAVLFINQQQNNGKQAKTNGQLLQNQSQIIKHQDDVLTAQKQEIDNLQHHIDCIVSLFTLPNRMNLVISNITDCQFSSTTTGATTSTAAPRTMGFTSPATSQPSGTQPAPQSPAKQPSPSPTASPGLIQQTGNAISDILKKLNPF